MKLPEIADEIQRSVPDVGRGTPRFWGVWFGRPYDDNVHRLLKCESKHDALRARFDEGEILTVWSPGGLVLDDSQFQILDAQRVRSEWFYYGRPKTAANQFFYDFVRTGETVSASSNVDWYTPELRTDLSLPAVEILII